MKECIRLCFTEGLGTFFLVFAATGATPSMADAVCNICAYGILFPGSVLDFGSL